MVLHEDESSSLKKDFSSKIIDDEHLNHNPEALNIVLSQEVRSSLKKKITNDVWHRLKKIIQQELA